MAYRRIKRPKDKEEVFEALVNSDDKIFDSFKDLMVFAACVGYAFEQKVKLASGTLEAIDFSVFKGECDEALFNMIGLADTEDSLVLDNTEKRNDEKATYFEEYANAGLDMIRTKVMEAPGRYLQNLLDFMSEHWEDGSEDPVDIFKGLADDLQRKVDRTF